MWLTPLVVAGLLVAGGLVLFGSLGPNALQRAADACSVGDDTLEASGDGTSLTVASGDDRSGLQTTITSVCVLTELDASDAVKGKIEDSAEGAGPQSDSWDDYVVTWTYDGRAGLEIVVEMGQGAVDDFRRA